MLHLSGCPASLASLASHQVAERLELAVDRQPVKNLPCDFDWDSAPRPTPVPKGGLRNCVDAQGVWRLTRTAQTLCVVPLGLAPGAWPKPCLPAAGTAAAACRPPGTAAELLPG